MDSSSLVGYLAHQDGLSFLEDELKWKKIQIVNLFGRLFICQGPPQKVCFAQETWERVEFADIKSIGQAAEVLKKIQPFWSFYSYQFHRRGELIQQKLYPLRFRPLQFSPQLKSHPPLGAWTLIEENKIAYSSKTSSSYADGEVLFVEDKVNPPSRAYLKLWEAFTRFQKYPAPGELCVDLGSCPGGWTWVLAQLGAKVISVDKAPLDPRLGGRPEITFMQESAFGLDPKSFKQVDWLFSDIICYPDKLYRLMESWKNSIPVKNFVMTIKFQGKTDFETLEKFQSVPGSNVVHLSCNKHELTWYLLTE